ncbi:MAG: class I adenylate cyclase [Gammaproteobacteria bacterium]|nr:class I adenylate cyclase [Gammaproteobacteria bacterium]
MRQLAGSRHSDESELDFKEIKQRFLRINRARLQRVTEDLRPSQRDFIELLPLLFHVNHPILPGYISKSTPTGIPEYLPGKETLNAARRLSRSFAWKKRAYRKFEIHGLYLMGSTGTIAYGEKSDFDIWVCHDSSLDGEQIVELQSKAQAIETWAATMDVEANIFLVDVERFRRGEHGHLSSESSGSALHYLLLEEFYRTSVLLAGRYPIWWLVPPEQEANYDACVEDIKLKRYIHSREHIDFGGLANISAEEFYGATLWLLYKGIHSPYKSILKILLMEAYASEHPHIDLLGVRYKKAVYEGEKNVNRLDPYLMMLQKVEEYLLEYNQDKRLDLVRRSFYFKVDEPLSYDHAGKKINWRRDLLSELVDTWGWSSGQIVKLDARDNWKINSVLEERQALIHEFTSSYRFLSLFTRSRADNTALISPSDLNVLGRKLYAAFERKAGKIEIVYRGITSDLHETHLSFHQQLSAESQECWMVYTGIVSEDDAKLTQPLKRGYSLIEIMAWCYFNKIVNKQTVVALYADDSDLTEKELYLLVEQMERLFPDRVLESSTTYDMLQPAQTCAVATFINVGLDPFSEQTRKGKHISSSRTDALKYGGKKENLTLSIDQIIVNSWNEVLTFKFFGIDGLLQCLQDYLKLAPPTRGKQPEPINAFSFSSYRGTSIARRIENLFAEVVNTFYSATHPESIRFVLGIEWEYCVLKMKENLLTYEKFGSIENLYKYLSRPIRYYQQTIFDSETLNDQVISSVYALNREGDVQLFYEVKNNIIDVYMLDERGSLHRRSHAYYDVSVLVNHYQEYFEAIKERLNYFARSDVGFQNQLFYRIDNAVDGKRHIVPQVVQSYFRSSSFISLQVLVDRVENDVAFTIYSENEEFSNLQYGDNLYKEVAKYIVSRRDSQDTYPIYITDLDLSAVLLSSNIESVQTVHYMHYKKVIEERLMNEMDVSLPR